MKVMGSNPGYLPKSFLLYYVIFCGKKIVNSYSENSLKHVVSFTLKTRATMLKRHSNSNEKKCLWSTLEQSKIGTLVDHSYIT